MVEQQFLKYEASGIAALLRTESLAVPFYQRSYSWSTIEEKPSSDTKSDRQQVVDFWSDLKTSYESKQSYFLGTVVLATNSETGDNTRRLVIDGQQRLATTSILLAAIRDTYRSKGEDAYARSTQQEYLGRFDRRVGIDQPQLILNTDDRDFFDRKVVLEEDVEPTTYSQQLIKNAYDFFIEECQQFVKKSGTEWRARLTELQEWLDESAQVVAITVATEADAFLIFETLNDRGADLTVADLLKNFLFSRSESRLSEVRDNWVRTLENLDVGRVGNQRFTTFARHFLSSKYGLVREREIYSRLKSIVNGPAQAVSFAQELADNSRLYHALISAESDFWADYPDSVTNAAAVLVNLRVERYRPLMLAVLATFPKSEIIRFVPAMVSWSVRMLCVGNLGGGTSEVAFCDAAREVRAGTVTSTEDILLTKVGGLVSTDSVFHSSFVDWKPIGRLARYALRALELETRGDPEPELVVNTDVEHVNLEHILPQRATQDEWPHFAADDRKLYTDRLGNLCLLQKGPNGIIGNKSWSVKRPVLADSNLVLTSSTAENDEWTADSIETRQRALADLALLAWPRDPRS
ncbi:Uncharacterized conserved protein [Mycobacteroides abscessus subsp. abscessus]|uniref:DUF262 domain-containing protein n=1 Tax=Mycobacteroides abscessus TaxID=36809 RepID=UPI00092ADCC9|nr:DUF262 domain-containing protein [Mycobacteroides abscessus]SHT00189.1 Uncharacterized conserved protein [Mycobacteroides abscessus subsp. abscessus]SHT24324.1 Uncharacterized conserved protein [Mycobacteroides abscessus subsp. abscessus]SHT62260.1 Uncharacterized conserved protein [Mycobacteroides abscessus subsp. abscessus]SHX78137.1 Uncharacterized conserved protein [Mycobacteroides abscessus subsp. abscessus]SIB42715.1 Uncharacterized conserved protein [Mycobacteroides abscessus subsp. 